MHCHRCKSVRLVELERLCTQDNPVFRCTGCGFLFSPGTPSKSGGLSGGPAPETDVPDRAGHDKTAAVRPGRAGEGKG